MNNQDSLFLQVNKLVIKNMETLLKRKDLSLDERQEVYRIISDTKKMIGGSL